MIVTLVEFFYFRGNPAKFEEIISQPCLSSHLTNLNFVQFSSFELFEFQTKLINQLCMFKSLRQIRLEHHGFHLTEKLLETLSQLENLNHIKIATRVMEKSLILRKSFNHINKVFVV